MNTPPSSAFQTKVAGRMTAVFFVCAGLPLAALATVTIVRTWNQLSESAVQRLRYEARTVAQEALARLDRLSNGLVAVGQTVHRDPMLGRGLGLERQLPVIPAALTVRFADHSVVKLAGDLSFPDLTSDEMKHLADWGRLIKADRPPAVLIVASGTPGVLAAATLDQGWVMGLDETDHLPPDSSACIVSPIAEAQCSIEVAPDEIAQAVRTVEHAETTINSVSGRQLAWVSALSLDAHYNARPWTVVLMRPLSSVRQPLVQFLRDFVLIVVVAVLLVAWISVHQVRRHLKPLAALMAATGRLTRQDFDRPVDVASGDEFETLGNAFNDMATKLRQQFADLEAFNIGTLTTLARAIDAKSPWTAGHSERVTASAVTIGQALRLPAGELDELRKGGLVHDIGKIATPLEILDKPARLTPEEERIMQLHPEQGVHILEPIAAFGPVLPIVGQHHERWDGSGYPRRLSGTDIARTARVLAVADVYDALRSDRPYREGMPHARVVNIIRDGAGSHFDPAVVSAFLQVEAEIDRAATVATRVSSLPPASAAC